MSTSDPPTGSGSRGKVGHGGADRGIELLEPHGASAAIQHKAAAAKRDHVRQRPNESDAPQSAATSCVGRSLWGQLLPEHRARRQWRWTSQGTLPRTYQQSILRRRLSNGTPNHWNRGLRDMRDPLTDTDSRIKSEHCVLYCIVLYSSIYIAPLNSQRQTEALVVRLAPRKETSFVAGASTIPTKPMMHIP